MPLSLELKLLIKNLNSKNDILREEASAKLIGIKNQELIPILINALENETNLEVVYNLKKALAILEKEYGNLENFLPNKKNIEQDNKAKESETVKPKTASEMPPHIREVVDNILKRIKNNDISLLNEALEQLPHEDDPYIKATYISAVGHLGSPDNIDDIVNFLNDSDFRVIANTIEALERLGNPKCVEYITKFISHPDNRIRANVIKALWKFTSSNVSINQDIFECLKTMLNSSDENMIDSALYVLSDIGDLNSIEILNEAVKSNNNKLAEKAQKALEKAQKKFEQINNKITNDTNIEKAIKKISAGTIDSEKGIDETTRKIINEIQSAIDKNDKSKLGIYINRLSNETNPYIKATLISAIGYLGNKTELEVLLPFLNDSDLRVVANTIEALERINNPKCIEHIAKFLTHSDNRIRANTIKAIWSYAHTNVTANRIIFERLKEMMSSTKNFIRESAIFVLGQIGSDEAIDLLNIAINDKDPSVREKAQLALEQALKNKIKLEKSANDQQILNSNEQNNNLTYEDKKTKISNIPQDNNLSNNDNISKVQLQTIDNETTEKKPIEPNNLKSEVSIVEIDNKKNKVENISNTNSNLVEKLSVSKISTLNENYSLDDNTRKIIDEIQSKVNNKSTDELNNWINKLNIEKNPYIKATLISAIGKLGNSSHMDILLKFLSDDDARVVANTVEALENINNPKCVEELVKLINHPDNRVNANVIKALWKYANSNVTATKIIIGKLKTMLNSTKTQLRESALYVLSEIATDEAIDLITIALNDKVESVKIKAKEALEKVEKKLKNQKVNKQVTTSVKDKELKQQNFKTVTNSNVVNQKLSIPIQSTKISLIKVFITIFFLFIVFGFVGFNMYWFVILGNDFTQLQNEIIKLVDKFKNSSSTLNENLNTISSINNTPEDKQIKKSFDANEYIEIGKQYLKEGYLSETINLFTNLTKKFPNNLEFKKILLEAYFKRGQTLFNIEIYESAQLDFKKIIELDTQGLYIQKAQSYLDKINNLLKNR